MKVSLNWLKKYVDFSWSAEELAERLTMLGIEVEGIEKSGGEFEGVVVAEVLASDKHPNADKLSVCRVTDGSGERQIVCGATNFKVGDKVPLILPGNSLPAKAGEQPLTIKAGRIRGVESQGMMCSPKELGLAEDAEGLLILPREAKVGQKFAEHLGRTAGDAVLDLEITPNRPDLNSIIGIAREISAVTGNPLRLPPITLPASNSRADQLVSVAIEDAERCPRYTARVVRGVRVGPSPDWLRHAVESVGVRSINNVVDVTNFVMMEVGQPLHAFDFQLLSKENDRAKIVVRPAAEGERFVTIDGQERTLNSSMLVISDPSRPLAVAGVMGGQNSEISAQTTDVLIESAYFKPQNIRATSKKLELRTESSYRFERGGDIEVTDWASQRAAQLIVETAGGELASGAVDAYPAPPKPRQITMRYTKVREVLGVDVPREASVKYLSGLGLKVVEDRADACTVAIPTFRVDLKREIDLVEEVGRLHGVEKIPATPPRQSLGKHPFDAVCDDLSEARRLLTGLGLSEAQGQTLISDKSPGIAESVALANPLSSDMNLLRASLLPGLLDALRHNTHHGIHDIALFEIGRVFNRGDGKMKEERQLAIAITGQRHLLFWSGEARDAKADVYDLKGLLEDFLEHFGVRGINVVRQTEPGQLWAEAAAVSLGKIQLGQFGQLNSAIARQYDLRDPVFLAQIDIDQLLARRSAGRAFKSLPAYPSVRRDVAMIVADGVTHQAVLDTIKQARIANLESIQLFDVFRGKNVPEGQKSVAYSFIYRSAERTLKDEEVNTAQAQVVAQLKQALNATVRE